LELRAYGRVLGRRWWVIIGLVVLVGVLTIATTRHPAPTYTASMAFSVGLKPEPVGEFYAYDRYYTWLTAEYLVDDLAEVVRRSEFAQAVSDRLAPQGIQVPAGAIGAATQAGKLHRILTVSISWPNESEIHKIADAIVAVLEQDGARFFGYLQSGTAVAQRIDGPAYGVAGKSLRERLDLPLRLLLALLAGIAIAFLWDYLDPTVRDRSDVESLGLGVLADIPRQRWWKGAGGAR
jgi:capsular polysaccharide biosynthesis protein